MNDNMRAWIEQVHCYLVPSNGEEEEQEVMVDSTVMLLRVSAFILGLEAPSSFEEVSQKLGCHYRFPANTQLDSDEFMELILFHAVSEHCPHRDDILQLIIQVIDEETKAYLMSVIQSYMDRADEFSLEASHPDQTEDDGYAGDSVERGDDCRAEVDNEGDQPDTTSSAEDSERVGGSGADKPVPIDLASTEALSGDSLVCAQCISLYEQIQRLQQNLDGQKKEYQREISELKQKLVAESHHVEDCEVAICEKDRAIFQLQQQLQDFDSRVKEIDKLSSQLAHARSALAALQDEMDIVRPQAQRADQLESSLAKFREKLEELSDVRQQLKTETEDHQCTYSKLVALEQEVNDLRLLRPQLDQYRAELAEITIANDDYVKRLEEQAQKIQELENERLRLSGDQALSIRQQESLAQELRVASEEIRVTHRVNGIGEGISELNPALMQELHRLRTDNADLLSRLDRSSMESLQKLEKEIADVKCVNSSLQQKWNKTKDQLASAERLIAELQSRLFSEQQAGAELRLRMQMASEMAVEEAQQRQMLRVQQAQQALLREEARTGLLAVGWKQRELGFRQDFDALQSTLETTSQSLDQVTTDLEHTRQQLHEREEELEEVGQKRRLEGEAAEERMQRMKVDHDEARQSLLVQHSQEIQGLQRQVEERIAAEAQKALLLSSELDEETQKRRRLDRTKRLLETEVQRLKVQLNGASNDANGGLGNGDFGLAAKELRSMQEQIDAQQAEIAALKQQLACGGLEGLAHPGILPGGRADFAEDGSAAGGLASQAMKLSGARGGGEDAVGGHSAAVQGGLRSRALRGGALTAAGPAISAAAAGSQSIQSFIEQTELNDKRVEQLSREKREILSKSLEDNKERLELSQKLIAANKENDSLRTELRKVRLEKERLERRLLKSQGEDKENVHCVNGATLA